MSYTYKRSMILLCPTLIRTQNNQLSQKVTVRRRQSWNTAGQNRAYLAAIGGHNWKLEGVEHAYQITEMYSGHGRRT